jgi:hypothetical protein
MLEIYQKNEKEIKEKEKQEDEDLVKWEWSWNKSSIICDIHQFDIISLSTEE